MMTAAVLDRRERCEAAISWTEGTYPSRYEMKVANAILSGIRDELVEDARYHWQYNATVRDAQRTRIRLREVGNLLEWNDDKRYGALRLELYRNLLIAYRHLMFVIELLDR